MYRPGFKALEPPRPALIEPGWAPALLTAWGGSGPSSEFWEAPSRGLSQGLQTAVLELLHKHFWIKKNSTAYIISILTDNNGLK